MDMVNSKVLDFAKQEGLENVEPHPFWSKVGYKGFKVCTSNYKNDKNNEGWILFNDKIVRLANTKEYEELFNIFY